MRTQKEMRGNMWCQFCEINSHHRRNMAKEITFLPDAWKAKHMACLSHIFRIFLLCWQTGFGKMESAFHFHERSITFYLSYFYVCQLEKDCLKWFKIISKNVKFRHILEKLKSNWEVLIKSHNFIYCLFSNSSDQDFSNERKQHLNIHLFFKIEEDLLNLVKKLRYTSDPPDQH